MAQDLGVVGQVYPIAEDDLLEVFQQQAQRSVDSGEWASILDAGQERARSYAARPPGRLLPVASRSAQRRFDPTLVVPYDIRDAEGRLLQPAGTRINPLQIRPFSRQLVFFDGDDPRQRRWADQFAEDWRTVPILVSGPVIEISEAWGRQVFFDQGGREGGRLVDHFGIERLPTLVYQSSPDTPWLTLEEVALQEDAE